MSSPARTRSASKFLTCREFVKCNEYINYLQDTFHFNLDRERAWPRSQEPASIFHQCENCIAYLFFKDKDGLDSAIAKFGTRLYQNQSNSSLNNFLQVLRAQCNDTRKRSPRNDTRKRGPRKVLPVVPLITSASATFDARFPRQIESAHTSFSATTIDTSFRSSIFSNRNESAQTSFSEMSPDVTADPLSTNNLLSDIPDVLMTDLDAELPGGQEQEADPTYIKGNCFDFQAPQPVEHRHIRNLPGQGLFVEDLPSRLIEASPQLRYECVRIAQSHNIPITQLADRYTVQWEDYSKFWKDVESLLPVAHTLPIKCANSVWSVAAGSAVESANVIRSGTLNFQTKPNSTMFRLDLSPLKREPKTCRFFRKFGASRFLTLMVPAPSQLPSYFSTHQALFSARLREWLVTPDKRFIGWSWNVFFARRYSSKGKVHVGWSESYKIYLFATRGSGLSHVSLRELLCWFIPIHLNIDKTFCKVFARLELGLSQTYPTLVFKPSQVLRVGDRMADGSPEDRSLNDDTLLWVELHDIEKPKVMNDGCSLISFAAASEVWGKLQMNGPLPSAFQARIGPWKGMWMLASPLQESNRPGDIWIEVTDSQRKFEPHQDDNDDSSYDQERLTFEVLTWSRTPSISCLHIEYLPILENRGISRGVLQKFMEVALDNEKDSFITALNNDISLLKWIQDESGSRRANSTSGTRMRGAFPFASCDRAQKLLECGFQANHFKYLLDLVKDLASKRFKRISNTLKVPLNRSTNVFGIADISGVLGPSEIHLSFSKPFSDELTGVSYQFLHNVDVLIARHPALRSSDIQKVRATFNINLSHLVDVIVFPTTGSFPLAGKLQGGDYDGDTFWVCWDPNIVGDFRNAPFQPSETKPEDLGIFVNRTKLSSIFCDRDIGEHHCDPVKQFYQQSFTFLLEPQLLGKCTNFHEKLCYQKNTISSPAINFTADLHDFLVDSAKNGYTYKESSWDDFINKHYDVDLKSMSKPAYKIASTVPLLTSNQITEITYNSLQIVDFLVFDVARPRARKIINEAKSFQLQADSHDRSPGALHLRLLEDPRSNVKAAMKQLVSGLDEIYIEWSRKLKFALEVRPEKDKQAKSDEALEYAYKRYSELNPINDPEISMWNHRLMDHLPTHWDLIKASALFVRREDRPVFVLGMAGDHICFAKAFGTPNPNVCTPFIFAHLKVRKLKKAIAADDSDDNAEGGGGNGEDRGDEGEESHEFHDTVEEMSQRMALSHLMA